MMQAFDLVELREVACKIHQLNAQWSEAKKASYVKHSVREYHIHRGLNHPRIVSLLDIFEIDNNTFATVLELCTGGDLDSYIKQHEVLPEREVRAIIGQVVSGLAYLNTKPRNVIHYDLKPANILFDANGECKITVRAL
jgi:tousled-like kinase